MNPPSLKEQNMEEQLVVSISDSFGSGHMCRASLGYPYIHILHRSPCIFAIALHDALYCTVLTKCRIFSCCIRGFRIHLRTYATVLGETFPSSLLARQRSGVSPYSCRHFGPKQADITSSSSYRVVFHLEKKVMVCHVCD